MAAFGENIGLPDMVGFRFVCLVLAGGHVGGKNLKVGTSKETIVIRSPFVGFMLVFGDFFKSPTARALLTKALRFLGRHLVWQQMSVEDLEEECRSRELRWTVPKVLKVTFLGDLFGGGLRMLMRGVILPNICQTNGVFCCL